MIPALTAQDYQNVLGFMDRATVKGIAEAKTLAILAFKIDAILSPPVAPPQGPPGKNRDTVPTESNVIELFPDKVAVNE